MQQALEALNLPSMKTQQMLHQRDEAITALRAKLEQPEQRKPLTDEQYNAIQTRLSRMDSGLWSRGGTSERKLLEAIWEAAHGIKGEA